MKSISYIMLIIGIALLASLAGCGETPSRHSNCWSKAPQVMRGVSGRSC
jgi:hypothetical protein